MHPTLPFFIQKDTRVTIIKNGVSLGDFVVVSIDEEVVEAFAAHHQNNVRGYIKLPCNEYGTVWQARKR